MKLIYCDDRLAVVEKGYGEISELPHDSEQTGSKGSENRVYTPALVQAALGVPAIYPVHRLDRGTAGLMVYALDQKCAAALTEQIQRGEMQKTYLAVVEGEPCPAEGELRDFLFYDRQKAKSFVVKSAGSRRGVKEAVLTYEVRRTGQTRFGTVSLVRLRLHTGRTHQIRVQFGARKMPLLGDGKYGSRANYKSCALWSVGLCFSHPTTGEMMEFTIEETVEEGNVGELGKLKFAKKASPVVTK